MTTLRIQHAVTTSFDAWKKAFDADPVGRKAGGVRRHRVHRGLSDPQLVMIDLDFDAVAQAEAFLARLQQLWAGPASKLVQGPQAWIVETVESAEE